ncbi:MAG: LysR substrate-binding domain-containing protein [Magnetovibrio sp.]|nr:LysR substrate-binding domain-containing protein [Magnetovibrio sp.]
MKHFDPELLQTLVAFAETGTLAQAAVIVGRTPSAITAQMQRLEDMAGVALLQANGRGRTLTEAGDQMLHHARHILAAQNEAWMSLKGTIADSRIRIGMTQDFADNTFSSLLKSFARLNPRVRFDLHIGRTAELAQDYQVGKVDLLMAMRQDPAPDEIAVIRKSMQWLCCETGLVSSAEEVPLALLDPPCSFRDAALQALEKQNTRYTIAATSSSLAGLWTAVRAGIAVTLRTPCWTGDDVVQAPVSLGLPKMKETEFSIRVREDADEPILRLGTLLAESQREK